ncbi:MAG: glycoside hydrolase family 3, partial [Propionibacteriaceae bacterium]|nr:glycoside hydrolase family 3 [Propionibacteriaceae bacterium]
MRRTLGLLAVGLLTLAGCGLPPAPAPDPPSPPATVPSPSHSPTPTPSPSPAPPEPARLAAITAARLNLEEKAGQLVMLGLWDATGSTDSTLAAIRSGGILFLGQDWELDAARATADRVKAMAHTAGVAPFVAVDQEGGQIQRLRGPGFEDIPSATVQGTWSPAQLTAAAARWGEQLRAAGVNLNFAPSADTVPPGEAAANAPIGQLERNFATDPAVVGASAAAF